MIIPSKKNHQHKSGLIFFAKGVVYLLVFGLLTILGVLLPEIAREERAANPNVSSALPYLVGAWFISIPIFVALYQALKLLGLFEAQKAFSIESVKALKIIRFCALIFCGLIIMGVVVVALVVRLEDPQEDITPLFSLSFVLSFVTIIIATFVAVVERLLLKAIEMKKENDLTI